MGDEAMKQLFSDQLREWADEGIAKVEREAREDFAELLKKALRRTPYKTYAKEEMWDTVFDIIDNILKECEED